MFNYIARQPIFDVNNKVYGYELLYRSDEINSYKCEDGNRATNDLIVNTFVEIGLNKISQGKRVFINFTEELLKSDLPYLLPNDKIIIEILEDVNFTEDIIEKIKKLHSNGYKMALDDFIVKKNTTKILDFIDYVKTDCLNLDKKSKIFLNTIIKRKDIKFIAEKVENVQAREFAELLGYEFFQGYFYEKPKLIKEKKIAPAKMTYVKLLNEISKDEIDLVKVGEIINNDAVLAYKLLKLINSVGVGLGQKVETVEHALNLLGTIRIKRWVSLIAIKGISSKEDSYVLEESLLRAKFLELFAVLTNQEELKERFFLLGLFSMMDVMLKKPMREILFEINANKDIHEALIEKKGRLYTGLKIAKAFEKNEQDYIGVLEKADKNIVSQLSKAYTKAAEFSEQIIKS